MKARGTPEPRCRAQALVLREEQHNRDYAPVDALRRQVREHSNHLSGRLISLQEDHDSYRSSHLRTIHYLPQLCAQENWVCECCGSGIAIPVGAARGCARRGRAWHVWDNRRARSHTVWRPRSSSAGCTLPASPGRRGPAAPCGAPSAAGSPLRSAHATHGPWEPSSPPSTVSPGLRGRWGMLGGSVAIWGVRRGRGGPSRPRRPNGDRSVSVR